MAEQYAKIIDEYSFMQTMVFMKYKVIQYFQLVQKKLIDSLT